MYFSYSYLNYYIMEYFFVNLIFKNLFLSEKIILNAKGSESLRTHYFFT